VLKAVWVLDGQAIEASPTAYVTGEHDQILPAADATCIPFLRRGKRSVIRNEPFGAVIGDWMVSDHGTVGYFGGTDAIFYAFALTSFFVIGGFYGWSGVAVPPLT
jgi:hypothetical protein